jgi:two-component system, NarL family, nitrate/nitrite response regulator NarL
MAESVQALRMKGDSGSGAVRAAVVSGSALIRAGLVDALEPIEGIEVAAALPSWRALAGLPVAVAIVDVATTPDASPADGRDDDAPPCVVLLPAHADASMWLSHGHAALPSQASAQAIVAAARAVAAGLIAAPASWWRSGAAAEPFDDPLTPREHDVLAQLAQGSSNRAIGHALAISAHTAKFHVAQIIAKLDAASRTHAVAKALRAGLIERD